MHKIPVASPFTLIRLRKIGMIAADTVGTRRDREVLPLRVQAADDAHQVASHFQACFRDMIPNSYIKQWCGVVKFRVDTNLSIRSGSNSDNAGDQCKFVMKSLLRLKIRIACVPSRTTVLNIELMMRRIKPLFAPFKQHNQLLQ